MPKFYDDGLDDPLGFERVESFGGGMDGYTRDTLLAPDASQYLENVLIQDNYEARTRPGADLLGTARGGKIQGLLWFDNGTQTHLIACANQAFTYWDGAVWNAMAGFTTSDAAVLISGAMGVDKALFTDGTNLRRWNGTGWDAAFTTTQTDPPTGCTCLVWHAGRMWAAGFGGGLGAGKEPDAICVSALGTFGAGDWDTVDKSFRVGSGDGDPVLGIVGLPSSTPSVAVLCALRRNSVHLVRVDPTSTINNYSQTVAPESVAGGLGVVGKRAFCILGGDLLFVAPDKSIRSLARMQAAAGQYAVSAPLSLPVQPYLDRVNWAYASTIAAWQYRQLAVFSVPLDSATTPNTVLVWNGRLQRWVGIWSGWTANSWETTKFSGQQRLVIGDNVGNVNQWKDFADATDDATYLDNAAFYATKVWTRGFLFGEPLNDKDAYHFEARFSTSNALINFTLTADSADALSWQGQLDSGGVTLPVDLPFDLVSPTNVPLRKGLRGQTPFNECYVKIESTRGWYSLRNVSLSAFLNTLANQ